MKKKESEGATLEYWKEQREKKKKKVPYSDIVPNRNEELVDSYPSPLVVIKSPEDLNVLSCGNLTLDEATSKLSFLRDAVDTRGMVFIGTNPVTSSIADDDSMFICWKLTPKETRTFAKELTQRADEIDREERQRKPKGEDWKRPGDDLEDIGRVNVHYGRRKR